MEGSVQGSVVQFREDSFLTTAPFAGPADITFLNPAGTTRVGVRYDGVSFAAEGQVLGPRWIFVESDDGAAYPTISGQDVSVSGVDVPVVPAPLLDEVFLNVTTAAELETTRAQLMILVVDESGTPVAGVDVDPAAARPAFIAYKQDGNWVTYLEETTREGLVFVPNLEALAFPGQNVPVFLTGAVDAELEVRLVRGAITIVTHVVP